jgi:hypothetical protein
LFDLLLCADCQSKDWPEHKKSCKSGGAVAVVDACQVCNKVFLSDSSILFDQCFVCFSDCGQTSHLQCLQVSFLLFGRVPASRLEGEREFKKRVFFFAHRFVDSQDRMQESKLKKTPREKRVQMCFLIVLLFEGGKQEIKKKKKIQIVFFQEKN